MSQPRLFVHVLCSSPPTTETACSVRAWLLYRFASLLLALDVTLSAHNEDSEFPSNVVSIHIDDLQPRSQDFDGVINVKDVLIEVRAYYFRAETASLTAASRSDNSDDDEAATASEGEVPSLFTTNALPCRLLHDSWDQLIFDPPIDRSVFLTLGRLRRSFSPASPLFFF